MKKLPEIVVIGSSAGGMEALTAIFGKLQEGFSIPIIVVQHISPNSDSYLATYLNNLSKIDVKEASEKEIIQKSTAYIAPPGYHLLIENNRTLSLSTDQRVNYARPSIDVLFETAAWVFREKTLAIVLTGANNDGAAGARIIEDFGGIVIVQSPETAHIRTMPEAALNACQKAKSLNLNEIAEYLNKITE